MTHKEITIKELMLLVKHNPEHTSLVNAIITALGDKWNDRIIDKELKAMSVGDPLPPDPTHPPKP